jgi:hypothetical protein
MSYIFTIAMMFALSLQPASAPGRTLAPEEVHNGKVVSVTADAITVLDSQDDDMDKFLVTSATVITRNGKPAKLIDVRAGDRVKVTATQDGEKLVAKTIAAMMPE